MCKYLKKENHVTIQKGKNIEALRYGVVLFFVVLFLCGMRQNYTYAATENDDVIKVGVYQLPGFNDIDENGNVSGYNYEYLYQIADITGWNYEFVVVSDMYAGMELLKERKIDLLAPVQKSLLRQNMFDFSEASLGKQYVGLLTTQDKEQYFYEDYKSFQGMTVAVVKDDLTTNYFIDYEKKHGFDLELVYYDTEPEALEAMRSGETNAVVANLLHAMNGDKVLARFQGKDSYYITYKDNQAMLSQLDEAMQTIQVNNPRYLEDLSREYFTIYDVQYLSVEQRRYIESLGTIKVGYMSDRIPLSYVEDETGEFCGITRQILDRIQELTGLQFTYVALPLGKVEYTYFKENNIAIAANVTYNKWNIHANKMTVTSPYVSMKKVFIAKKDLSFDKDAQLRIATNTGSSTLDSVIAENYPLFTHQNYKYLEDCFEAVLLNKADLMVLNQYVADYWLARPQNDSLHTIPVEGLTDNQCLAIFDFSEDGSNTGYKELRDIINVAISQISEDEISSIIIRNTTEHRYQYTSKDFFYQYRDIIGMLVIVGIIMILGIIVYFSMRKRNRQELLEKERYLYVQQKRYELLLEKSEEVIFETDLNTNERVVSDMMWKKFGWTLENRKTDDVAEGWKVMDDDKDILRNAYKEVVETKEAKECTVRLLTKDKGFVWCKISRYPILNKEGQVVKIIGRIADIDAQMKENNKLREQNRTDSMTGLLNKKSFLEEARNYLEGETAQNFCLVFLDLDHFKTLNDTMGHLVGDEAIKEAAAKIQLLFANSDLVARFGGDEFCILVKNIPLEKMLDKLEIMSERLRKDYQKENVTVRVTASIGAIYYHKPIQDIRQMMERVDCAVYESKRNGRDKITFVEVDREDKSNG